MVIAGKHSAFKTAIPPINYAEKRGSEFAFTFYQVGFDTTAVSTQKPVAVELGRDEGKINRGIEFQHMQCSKNL